MAPLQAARTQFRSMSPPLSEGFQEPSQDGSLLLGDEVIWEGTRTRGNQNRIGWYLGVELVPGVGVHPGEWRIHKNTSRSGLARRSRRRLHSRSAGCVRGVQIGLPNPVSETPGAV